MKAIPIVTVEQIRVLITDTLFERRKEYQGSFSHNAAGWELRSMSEVAIPLIEKAIMEQVMPEAGRYADHNALLLAFPGLISLWMAYLVIGSHHQDVGRLVQFMRELDGPVLGVGMLATSFVFRTVPKQAPDDVIPTPIWEFVREVAGKSAGNDAELARHVLKSLYRPSTKNSEGVGSGSGVFNSGKF